MERAIPHRNPWRGPRRQYPARRVRSKEPVQPRRPPWPLRLKRACSPGRPFSAGKRAGAFPYELRWREGFVTNWKFSWDLASLARPPPTSNATNSQERSVQAAFPPPSASLCEPLSVLSVKNPGLDPAYTSDLSHRSSPSRIDSKPDQR